MKMLKSFRLSGNHCLMRKHTHIVRVGTVRIEGETVEDATPMWCAAATNKLNIVKFLVKCEANVNATTATNSTALRVSCFDGRKEMVRFLVRHGADVEIPNKLEHTCLMVACCRGPSSIAKFLLTQEARVNRRFCKGSTALHECSDTGNLRCLILLLKHGAIMREDEYGLKPVLSSANYAHKTIVDYLCELRSSNGELAVPIEEQAAAHELLGASFLKLQSREQDAVASWKYAMSLRQKHLGYTKRLPPIRQGALHHYAWGLIESMACNAVTKEIARMKNAGEHRNACLGVIDQIRLQFFIHLLFQVIPLGPRNDVSSCDRRPPDTMDEYVRKYLHISEIQMMRRMNNPEVFFDAVETEFRTEEEAECGARTTGERDEASELIRRLQRYSYATFGPAREFADIKELEAVRLDNFALQLQPLLIRLRILGPDHPFTIYFLRYPSSKSTDLVAVTQFIAFRRYSGELQKAFRKPLACSWRVVFGELVKLYSLIFKNRCPDLPVLDFHPSLLLNSLELAVDNVERGIEFFYQYWIGRTHSKSYACAWKRADNLRSLVARCLDFIALFSLFFCSPTSRLPPLYRHRLAALRRSNKRGPYAEAEEELKQTFKASTMNEELWMSFARTTYIPSESEYAQMRSRMTPKLFPRFYSQVNRLNRLDPRVDEGASLMHLAAEACRFTGFEIVPVLHADLLRLLAALGADPNAVDANGYRPIGLILTATLVIDAQKADLISNLVLHCGAHFDVSVMPIPGSEFESDQISPFADGDDVAISIKSMFISDLETELATRGVVDSSRIDYESSKMYKEKYTWSWSQVSRRILNLTDLKPLQHTNLAPHEWVSDELFALFSSTLLSIPLCDVTFLSLLL